MLPFGNRSVPKVHDVQTLEASAEQVRAAEELTLSAFRKSLDEYLKGRQDPRPQPADDRAIFGLADRAVRDYHAATARDQALPRLSQVQYWEIRQRLYITHGALGPLGELLSIEGVEDIHIDGTEAGYLEFGDRREPLPVKYASEDDLVALVRFYAEQAGKHFDPSNPIVTVTMRDGSRLNAILPPVAKPLAITIRKQQLRRFRKTPYSARKSCFETQGIHSMDLVADLLLRYLPREARYDLLDGHLVRREKSPLQRSGIATDKTQVLECLQCLCDALLSGEQVASNIVEQQSGEIGLGARDPAGPLCQPQGFEKPGRPLDRGLLAQIDIGALDRSEAGRSEIVLVCELVLSVRCIEDPIPGDERPDGPVGEFGGSFERHLKHRSGAVADLDATHRTEDVCGEGQLIREEGVVADKAFTGWRRIRAA